MSLANKDDLCIDFFPCIHLPNLLIALSITNKLFVMDISKQKLILELSNGDYFLNMDKFQAAFASRNQLLYAKGWCNKMPI